MLRAIYADDAIRELQKEFPSDDFGKIIRCISRTPSVEKREQIHEEVYSCEFWDNEIQMCALCRPSAYPKGVAIVIDEDGNALKLKGINIQK